MKVESENIKFIKDERIVRQKLLNHAKQIGCEQEMLSIFRKADKAMKNCTNEKERKDIGKLYAVMVYNLLGAGGELYIDGQLVVKSN